VYDITPAFYANAPLHTREKSSPPRVRGLGR
jgi:hypothetical protein